MPVISRDQEEVVTGTGNFLNFSGKYPVPGKCHSVTHTSIYQHLCAWIIYIYSSLFEWLKRGRMPIGLGLNTIWIPDSLPILFFCVCLLEFDTCLSHSATTAGLAWPFEFILFSYVLIWHLNGWSSTSDVAHKPPFEIQTSKSLISKCLGIKMVGIQIQALNWLSENFEPAMFRMAKSFRTDMFLCSSLYEI